MPVQVLPENVIVGRLVLAAEDFVLFLQIVDELLFEILGQDDKCLVFFCFNNLIYNGFYIGMPAAETFCCAVGRTENGHGYHEQSHQAEGQRLFSGEQIAAIGDDGKIKHGEQEVEITVEEETGEEGKHEGHQQGHQP